MAGAAGIRAGQAYVELSLEAKKFNEEIGNLEVKFENWASKQEARMSTSIQQAAIVGLPIAMAAKTFAGFDDAMRATQAVADATRDEFEAMSA